MRFKIHLLVFSAVALGTAACSSGRSGGAAPAAAAPEAVRTAVVSLPENPCELLTAEQVAAATQLPVTRARRVPDIGEIIRAEKEGRPARANTICSYETPSEFESITIIVPPVSEQNSAAYWKAREEYFRQFHAEAIAGIGEDAWLGAGAMLNVLAGKTARFTVATRVAREKSPEVLAAVARAVIARLYR